MCDDKVGLLKNVNMVYVLLLISSVAILSDLNGVEASGMAMCFL